LSVKINIPSYLQPYTAEQEVVEISGSTVGECLDRLVEQFPDISQMLYARESELFDYVSIYVNGEFASNDESARPVKDGDELHILYILGGG
jgi:molybdopterin converting factor small subunit